MSGPAAGLLEPGLATLEALNRLAQSRDRLRGALADPGGTQDRDRNLRRQTSGEDDGNDVHRRNADHLNGRRSDQADRSRGPSAGLFGTGGLGLLTAKPVVGLLLGLARLWWVRQPAPVLLALVGNTADLALQPIASRHPFRLVLGAAAAGAALTVLRPWRWVNRSAVTRAVVLGLLPQVLSRLRTPTPGGSGWLAQIAAMAQGVPTQQGEPQHVNRSSS